MARVTVEDCIEKISNRFELVMVAAQRARKIGSGSALTIDRDNDKNPVVALREIAETTVSTDDLKEELIRSHQRIIMNDDDKEDVIDMMDGEAEWGTMARTERAVNFESDEDDDDDMNSDPTLEDLAGDFEDEE